MFDYNKTLPEKLTDYFKKNVRKGYTKESIRWALINQGYSRREVENAIKRGEMELAAQAPVLKTRPEIDYQRVAPVQSSPPEKQSWWKKFFG